MENSVLLPEVKMTVIYDNRCDNRTLQEGWGFSVLVEYDKQKILFDTGGDPEAFFSNSEKLDLDFSTITHVVFSHRHWDHRAGIEDVLDKLREKTQIFLPKLFFPLLLRRRHPQLIFKTVNSFAELRRNIYSLVLQGGFLLYEQCLILDTTKGTVVLTGCAHPGIVNILKAVQTKLAGKNIHFVMGGFHLLFTPGRISTETVREFQTLDVKKVAPCHCSGDHTIRQFKEAYGNNFYKIGAGTVISI